MRAELPPGPRYPSLIQGVGLWTRPLAYSERLRARYGKRFTVRFPLSPPFVIITDPEEVKQVYTAAADVLHPGEGTKVLEPLVGRHSVLLLDEDAHIEQRKLMLPAFHGERMERLSGLVGEVTEHEVQGWDTGEAEMQSRMQRLTLEIILRAVFGLDPGPRLDALRERITALLAFGGSPLTLLPPPSERVLRALDRRGPLKGFFSTRGAIDELLFAQIDERRAADPEGGDRDDVLAMLLAARHEDGRPMSRQELRDELMTLLAAGHETTATTLAWAFERLAREPRVVARLSEELRSGASDGYLTATIQEVQRRRPVLPNTAPRLVKKPIEVGGWRYPEGVCLVANAYLLHHDPQIYPDPYAFRPERFLENPPGTYTWIPFGGGRRRCLGASFATLEMKTVLRCVLRAHGVSPAAPAHEPPRRHNITIRPSRGGRIALRADPAPAAVAT